MKNSAALCSALIGHFICLPALATEASAPTPFDELIKIELGLSNSELDGDFRVDTQQAGFNLGTSIDLEDTLGLSDSSVRDSHLRLSWQPKPRHRLTMERINFERRSDITAAEDFQYGDMTVAAGAALSSRFDLAVDQYQYAYSVYRSDRQEARLSLGINVLKLDAGLSASGEGKVQVDGEELISGGSYTVTSDNKTPVPVIGVGYSLAITPWWLVNAGAEYFELDYDNSNGKVVSWEVSTEAHLAKYFVLGLRYSDYRFDITSEENHWRGRLDWHHNGPTAYLGLRWPASDATPANLFDQAAVSERKIAAGPYVDISIGASNQSADFSRKTVSSVSVKPEASSRSDEDLSFAVGYRVSPRFGVELGLMSQNKFWGNDRVKDGEQVSPGGGHQSYKLESKMEVEAVIPWLVAYQPVTDNIELQARLGYGFYDARYGTSGFIKIEEPGNSVRYGYDENNSDHSEAFAFGLGGYWHFNHRWSLGGQYQYHSANFSDSGNKADWNSHRVSLNLGYHF